MSHRRRVRHPIKRNIGQYAEHGVTLSGVIAPIVSSPLCSAPPCTPKQMRKRDRIDSFLTLIIFLLACTLLAIWLSGCSQHKQILTQEPEHRPTEYMVAEVINEDYVDLGKSLIKVGNRITTVFATGGFYQESEETRQRRQALEDRINEWYAEIEKTVLDKELREYGDIRKVIGTPIAPFLSDETWHDLEVGDTSEDFRERLAGDIYFAEKALRESLSMFLYTTTANYLQKRVERIRKADDEKKAHRR